MKINSLVNVPGEYGIGKIVNILEDGTLDVEFFISISNSIVENFTIDLVTEVFLGRQTRVYHKTDKFGWRIGRVVYY